MSMFIVIGGQRNDGQNVYFMWLSGLPNTFGEYDETPEITGQMLKVGSELIF